MFDKWAKEDATNRHDLSEALHALENSFSESGKIN